MENNTKNINISVENKSVRSKKTFLIIIGIAVLIIVLGVGMYIYLKYGAATPEERAINKAGETAEKITESATQGAMPSLDVKSPLEKLPDVNPASRANPFTNVKTNPFK